MPFNLEWRLSDDFLQPNLKLRPTLKLAALKAVLKDYDKSVLKGSADDRQVDALSELAVLAQRN